MYDQREKAQRDYEWAISGARELGLEQGREEGREEGLQQGREQGREQGKLAGRIQILQQLLNEPISGDAELLCQNREALDSLLATLLQRLTTNRS